jgi:hypothetical protein
LQTATTFIVDVSCWISLQFGHFFDCKASLSRRADVDASRIDTIRYQRLASNLECCSLYKFIANLPTCRVHHPRIHSAPSSDDLQFAVSQGFRFQKSHLKLQRFQKCANPIRKLFRGGKRSNDKLKKKTILMINERFITSYIALLNKSSLKIEKIDFQFL